MTEIIVIGGGAAGMMAARTAAEAGAHVTLLEHMEKLGRKIYITGKGRCNVTNACEPAEFLQEVAQNPRFLYSALSAFAPNDMIRFLESHHCPTVTERGRRVYPASQKASDVTRVLEHELSRLGVQVLLHTEVRQVLTQDGHAAGVLLADGRTLSADAIILATGGRSYPATGSTGMGYAMAETLGHTIRPLRPSLSALTTEDTWPCALQGLSLKNVTLEARRGKKVLYSQLGEMLFTHFGISGPLVLEMSCHLERPLSEVQVTLCLKPALSEEQLDQRLQREIQENPRQLLEHMMEHLLPKRFAALFPALCGLPERMPAGSLTREMRRTLVSRLLALPIRIADFRPIEEAIVTRGGVTVREVNPATMESKLVPGLYFAGEVLDVDAHTGGYNLHIAFSTGYLAGKNAAGGTST